MGHTPMYITELHPKILGIFGLHTAFNWHIGDKEFPKEDTLKAESTLETLIDARWIKRPPKTERENYWVHLAFWNQIIVTLTQKLLWG